MDVDILVDVPVKMFTTLEMPLSLKMTRGELAGVMDPLKA